MAKGRALFFVIILAGCATSPETLRQLDDRSLCINHGIYGASPLWESARKATEDEIRRRQLIAPNEWGAVYNKRVQRGGGLCSLYAVMGQPSTENRSVGSWGTRIQHVYRSAAGYSATYIYTLNGKIDAWQD